MSRNGRNNGLIGLHDLANERKLSKIVNYQIFIIIPHVNFPYKASTDERLIFTIILICFVKGRHFPFFTNLINSKFISELFQVIKQFSYVLMQHKYRMTNSDMHKIFFAHAQLQNSLNNALNTIWNITQTRKETNWWSFAESLAGCLENVINL